MANPADNLPISLGVIERRIYFVRGQKVMRDSDLAELYSVPTKRLNEAVKRNLSRFPEDFMFKLTEQEIEPLRSQFATSNEGRGGQRYLPYFFTEQGVAMLSSVLNSKRAIAVNIAIMRAFVKLRQIVLTDSQVLKKVKALEDDSKLHGQVLLALVHDINKLKNKPKDLEDLFFSSHSKI